MNNLTYLNILKNKAGFILSVVLLMVVIGLTATVFQPFKYRSTVQVLVIEQGEGSDAYSAIRSAEKMSNNLAYLVYSTSFMDKVLQGGVATKGFSNDLFARKQEWKKTIVTRVVPDTGILSIDVYHTDKNQTAALAGSIAAALSGGSVEYTGNSNIVVKTVDQPITSKYPVKPNIALNIFTSIALGLVLSVGYVLFSYNPEKEAQAEKMISFVSSPLEYPEVKEKNETARNSEEETEAQYISFNDDFSSAQIPVLIPVETDNQPIAVTDDVLREKEESDAFYKMLFPEK
ncbi:MAG: hypothetical protein WC310_00600 [Patescibacteria group bacterium]|jgi:capsular polysaccharide biosynthesis protein